MASKTIGHYEILEKLGEGGMGVVFKARDTRLNRFVAVKLLPVQRVGDEDSLRRFTQEAHTASALNHPNIVTIHDIGTHDGEAYIVMEYIAGKTLDQVIPRKGMRLAEVLKISVQVADALTAAALAGVIHRDVKPGNMMVTDSGLVKVLDFGLAKVTERAANPDQPTATIGVKEQPRTREGTIIGTVSYMSPEQAEGKPLDPRSDIFSFGVVLYEMVTGQRAFQGETSMSTISAILRDDPKSAAELATDVPRDLEKIITRCLRKDPARRFQNMADVRVALLELKEETESGKLVTPAPTPRKHPQLWPYATIAIVLAAAIFFFLRPRAGPPATPLATTVIASASGVLNGPSFSPDGNQIAFAWAGDQGDTTHIYVKLIGNETPLRLTSADVSDQEPSWAPDGKSIAFLRQNGTINTISPIGGAERRIANLRAGTSLRGISRPTWSQNSKWLLLSGAEIEGQPTRIFRISVDTGEKKALALGEDFGVFDPALSPDSRRLAYYRYTADRVSQLVFVELDEELQPRGIPKPLQPSVSVPSSFAWTADNSRLVLAGRNGASLLSIDGSAPRDLGLAADNITQAAVSRQGNRVALVRSFFDQNVWRAAIEAPGKLGEPASFISSPRIDRVAEHGYSPDGRKIAFESNRAGNAMGLWLADSEGLNPVLLAGGPFLNGSPSWSPDNLWLAFDSRREGKPEIYIVAADGGAQRRLTNSSADSIIPAWSKDGKWIYFSSNRGGSYELFRMPSSGGEPSQLTHAGGWAPRESPDGKFIYYTRRKPITDSGPMGAPRSPLMRIPVEGGEETEVIESVVERGWASTVQGVWNIWPLSQSKSEVRYFDFATRKTTAVRALNKPVATGISLSPDGRYLLYNQIDRSGTELLLVENFR